MALNNGSVVWINAFGYAAVKLLAEQDSRRSESSRRAVVVVLSCTGSSQAAWIEIHYSNRSEANIEWNLKFRVLVHTWAARCNSEFAWVAELCSFGCGDKSCLEVSVGCQLVIQSIHRWYLVGFYLERAHAFTPFIALRTPCLLRNFLILSVGFGSSHPLWCSIMMFRSGTF